MSPTDIKSLMREHGGTPTERCIALLIASGITSTKDIAEALGVTLRAVQKAKQRTSVREPEFASEPQDANHSSTPNHSSPKSEPQFVSQPSETRAHATKELPSEVVILNNTPLPPKPTPLEALRAFEAYNEVALRCGLPQAAKLTPGRSRSILARLKTYGPEGWAQALANLEKSAFCRGQTSTNFRADLDFVCQAKSFDRLHDGGYGNGAHTAPKPGTGAIHVPKSQFQIDAELQEIGARFLS